MEIIFAQKLLLRRKSPFSLNKQRRTFLAKRLRVALDVASALQHIHQHDIVYLDLKPENVGFDAYDNVQLFYFGSAKQLDYGSNAKDFNERSGNKGVQPLTPEVALGLPYNQRADVYSFGMAPEVALGLPYNQNADVYSFGLLLWQIVALAMPFGEIVCE
jgi:serine/threonine protein kinase